MANWKGGAQGAVAGGAAGSAFGPWGTAVGAGIGGLFGLFGGGGAEDAAKAQRESLDQAMKRLQEFSAQQYAQRQKDLAQTLAFYGPAQRYLESIYAQPQGTVAGPAPRGMPGAPGGGLATPPGFPKPAPAGPMDYMQGPRRGIG